MAGLTGKSPRNFNGASRLHKVKKKKVVVRGRGEDLKERATRESKKTTTERRKISMGGTTTGSTTTECILSGEGKSHPGRPR